MTAGQLALGLAAAACGWLVLRLGRRRRTTGPVDATGVQELLVAVEEALLALEERSAQLTRLVTAADERLAALAALSQRPGPEPVVPVPPPPPPPPTAPKTVPTERQDRQVKGKAETGRTGASPRPTAASPRRSRVAARLAQAQPHPAPTAAAPPRPARAERVVELAQAGLGPAAIARKLGIPGAEVELILGLRRLG